MNRVLIAASITAILLAGCSGDDETTTAPSQPATTAATGAVTTDSHTPKRAAAPAPKPQVQGKVVGRVGNHPFTEQDIDAEFARMPANFQRMKGNPAMRANILNNLMTRYALTEQARRMGIADDPAVRRRIESAQSSILLQELNRRQRARLGKIDEQALRAYYKANIARFSQPETVHARHILVKSKKLAKRILRKLHKGADFAALARKYSEDKGSKERGGDIGTFPRGRMAPEFEQAAFTLKKDGAIAGPVKTRFGYHIIQRLGHTPAGRKPFDQVKEQIRRELEQQAFRRWVAQTKQQMGVTVLDPRYQRGPHTHGARPASPWHRQP